MHDVHPAQHLEDVEGHIQLPPEETIAGRGLMVMVVVMPTLAEGGYRDEHRVPTGIGGGIATTTHDMGQ